MSLKLKDNYSLTAEPHLKGFRLIVLNNNEEVACRKETIKNLVSFIHSDKEQIFKGRLRLFKSQHNIAVQVNGNYVGTVTTNQFMHFLK